MKDWRTTVSGIVTAVGISIQGQEGWLGVAGKVLAAGGAAATGLLAADAAVKQPPKP